MEDEYLLTSSNEARAVIRQAHESLRALAKNNFRAAAREMYRGTLLALRSNDTSALRRRPGAAHERIVEHASSLTHAGWTQLSVIATGSSSWYWDGPIAAQVRNALFAYVQDYHHADAVAARERYAAVREGATDAIIDAVVSAVENGVPLEYVIETIDGRLLR